MDISPKNIAGKYPGKIGLKMFIHLINKVSKIVQPTVIFMDQADRPFSKKVIQFPMLIRSFIYLLICGTLLP